MQETEGSSWEEGSLLPESDGYGTYGSVEALDVDGIPVKNIGRIYTEDIRKSLFLVDNQI